MAGTSKLDKLESLRGMAAIYVVFHHIFQSNHFAYKNFRLYGIRPSSLFGFGQEAVILFFLLSGFVIEYSFAHARNKSFKEYLSKRFFRIYIPLVVIFIVSYLVRSFESGQFIDPDIQTLMGNLFMLQDISKLKSHVVCDPYMENSPLWSLSYEWWFYMIYYLIQRVVPAKKKQFAVVVGLVGIALFSYFFFPFFLNRILLYLGIWWCGVELARCYLEKKEVSFAGMRNQLAVLVAVVLAFFIYTKILVSRSAVDLSIGRTPLLEIRHFSFTFISIILAIAWYKAQWWGFEYIVAPFKIFAPISYVMYIAHYFIAVDPVYLNFIEQPLLRVALAFSILLCFSYVVEIWIYPRVRAVFYAKS